MDTPTREQTKVHFNSVTSSKSRESYEVQVTHNVTCGASGDKNASSSKNSTDCSWETGIYNENNCTYYDNISSCCSWSLNGNTSDLLEIANNSPILLGPHEAHVNTSEGCLHTSSNEAMTRTEGDCSLSLILSDTSSQSQLVNNGHSAIHSEPSLCILKGATSSEGPFVVPK